MKSHITINRNWFISLIKPIIELSNLATSQLNCYKCIKYDHSKRDEVRKLIRQNPYLKALGDLHTDITQFKAYNCKWLRGICNIDINSIYDIRLFIDMFKFYKGLIDIGNLNEIKESLQEGGIDKNQLSFFEEYQNLHLKINEDLLNELSLLIDTISLSYKPKEIIQGDYIPPTAEQREHSFDGIFGAVEHKRKLEYIKFLSERKKQQEEQEEVLGGNKKKIIKKLRKYIS